MPHGSYSVNCFQVPLFNTLKTFITSHHHELKYVTKLNKSAERLSTAINRMWRFETENRNTVDNLPPSNVLYHLEVRKKMLCFLFPDEQIPTISFTSCCISAKSNHLHRGNCYLRCIFVATQNTS